MRSKRRKGPFRSSPLRKDVADDTGGDPSVPRFLVFAHMRSGSSTFVRALECHPAIRILSEPFNSTFTTWRPGDRNYLELTKDPRTLDEQLEHMYRSYNGIKSLGYQLPWELNAHMLRDRRRHVIFLKRTNVLQTVVSGLIAQQTGVWHRWDLEGPLEDRYACLEPLSIDFVRGGVDDVKEEIEYYDRIVSSRTGPTLVLTHDELYLRGAQQRRERVVRAFTFLGLQAPPLHETELVMDPARTKLNSAQTYEMLPNAREIDEVLGSDETGWLFGSDHGR